MPWWAILLIVIAAFLAVSVTLYFTVGKKLLTKKEEEQEKIEAAKQVVSILTIDKKKLPLKESGLPDSVITQAPALAKLGKIPVVKAKVGKQIMNLVAEKDVFEKLPLKKQCKVELSGIYITKLVGVR